MNKHIVSVKVKSGVYYLTYDGIKYAIATKCKDRGWRYDDSNQTYYFKTLSDCRIHFSLINWSNGRKKPLPMINYIVINKRLLDSGALLKKYQVIYDNGRVEVFKTPTPEIDEFIQENRNDFTKVKYTFNGV